MTTETVLLDVAEPAAEHSNGHVQQGSLDLVPPVAPPPATLPEPDSREKVGRFADPRREVVTILRDRLERVLQRVDDDPVWHGINAVTAKDLHLAIEEALPPASIFAASVRTPAYLYVSAVCPICSISSEITLVVGVKAIAEGSSVKLQLTAKAAAKPHQCYQTRAELGGPSRPEARGQVALDLGGDDESDAGDVDMGEAAPNDDNAPDPDADDGTEPTDDGDLEDQLEAALDQTDKHAIHAIAGTKPVESSSDLVDLDDLPF